jgi:hypothetical protein
VTTGTHATMTAGEIENGMTGETDKATTGTTANETRGKSKMPQQQEKLQEENSSNCK